MQEVLKLEKKEGLSRVIVALTDGYVSVERETLILSAII